MRACVILPTFNNGRMLAGVVRRTAALQLPMFVVNDGATDQTAAILQAWVASAAGRGTTVLTHAVNRGKAAALRTGFDAAVDAGFTHAATLDTDGQLDPEQLPVLIAAAGRSPQAFVLGYRNDLAGDYPARSRLGRRLSNLMVRMECGLDVHDSQCGLRIYPLAMVRAAGCRSQRFCFETEVITRAGWLDAPILQLPVRCRYFDPPERVSHFRPWVDTLRSLRMHGGLMVRAMVRRRQRRAGPASGASAVNCSALRRLAGWLSPGGLWQDVRASASNRLAAAAGLGVGAFIANLPLYGLHTLISLVAARRLHLHPATVVAGSLLATPPLGPLLIASAIVVGHVLMGGSIGELAGSDLELSATLWPVLPLRWAAAWAVGSIVVGLVCLAIVFVAAALCLRWVAAPVPVVSNTHGESSFSDADDARTVQSVQPVQHA